MGGGTAKTACGINCLPSVDPLRYLVAIVRGVTLKNAPWSALWPNLMVLAGFAIVLLY
jgi:ABC-type multidrug transport system permease subunit